MIRRAFSSSVKEFLNFSPKRSLPQLNEEDPDKNIKNIPGFFEHIMKSANPNPYKEGRLLIPMSGLRKLIVL